MAGGLASLEGLVTVPRICCRFCNAPLQRVFVDLGMTPLANDYLTPEDLFRPEVFYPLRAFVCERCFLVQLPESEKPAEIFSDYAYFSSYSDSWLEHNRAFALDAIERFQLGPESRVIEVASNDGYLLRFFKEQGIPVLGIEPAANVAEAAEADGIPTLVEFFGADMARRLVSEGRQADLLAANNVLAHVPDLNDFVEGLSLLLAPGGVATLEFPHLLQLIQGCQFDTIYHEHFSYFSFTTARQVFAHHGLTLFHVEEISTHGGSLRIYARHADDGARELTPAVEQLLATEERFGLGRLETYLRFAELVRESKRNLLRFLVNIKEDGKTIVGYGAPAKGNTLLNYCGLGTDILDFTVDRSPHKQGRFLPGSQIPIHSPDKIREIKPDYVFILPWNLREEIVEQMSDVRQWDGRFLIAIPEVQVLA